MPSPNVQHNFDGEQQVLDSTFDRRLEVRKALHNLHQDFKKTQDVPMQVFAEVKIRIPGPTGFKEHTYTVQVTDGGYDAAKLANQVENASDVVAGNPPATCDQTNGQRSSSAEVADGARPQTIEDATNADEAEDERPSKRARIGDGPSGTEQTSVTELNTVLKQVANILRKETSGTDDSDLADFMKEWHERWAQQGGWLFDNVNKLFTAVNEVRQVATAAANARAPNAPLDFDRGLALVQQVLGQAINASNGSIHIELAKIVRLIPWLEECRKTATDKVQEREEQWRLTSANFHDNARKNRETAEMVLMKKLHEQQQMMEKQWDVMKKLAHANNIELDEDVSSSRDESLGVQLTRELREEAQRDRRQSVPEARGHAIEVDADT